MASARRNYSRSTIKKTTKQPVYTQPAEYADSFEEESDEEFQKDQQNPSKQMISSVYASDPYFGHRPMLFTEPEDGWKSISKAVLTGFAPKHKVYNYEKFLPAHLQEQQAQQQLKQRKRRKSKPGKAVNFFDPHNLPLVVKHINKSIINPEEEPRFRRQEGRADDKLRKLQEELRTGLIDRKKSIFLAAISQPYHTKKFQDVMNQINAISDSPSKLKSIEELKNYNHIVKVQKRIIAQTMKPHLDQFKEKIAVVDGKTRRCSFDAGRELLILENEEENPHLLPKVALYNENELVNEENRKQPRTDVNLEAADMIDSANELKDNGQSRNRLSNGGRSRESTIVKDSRRAAPSSIVFDLDKLASAKQQRLPRFRRKSDTSYFSGGECKKLAATNHIVLPTDLRPIQSELTETSDLRSERSPVITRSRAPTIRKDRSNKNTITSIDLKTRNDLSSNQPKESNGKQITEEESIFHNNPTAQSDVQEESILTTARKNVAENKSQDFRVLSNSKTRVRAFVPVVRISKTQETEEAQQICLSPILGEKNNSLNTSRMENDFQETDSTSRFLAMKSQRKSYSAAQTKPVIRQRSYSQPKLGNPSTEREECDEYQKNKELRLGLESVLKINKKARIAIFKTPEPQLMSQKSTARSQTTQGSPAKGSNVRFNTGISETRPTTMSTARRTSSCGQIEIKKNLLMQPYLTHLAFCRPKPDSDRHEYEAFEIGIGPKKGPLQTDFKYEKRSQTAVKIRRSGSNFYLRA